MSAAKKTLGDAGKWSIAPEEGKGCANASRVISKDGGGI